MHGSHTRMGKSETELFSNILPYDERVSDKRLNNDVHGPTLHTSPRPHHVVTQTSGEVVLAHRTLGRRGGTQTARQKQKLNKMSSKKE